VVMSRLCRERTAAATVDSATRAGHGGKSRSICATSLLPQHDNIRYGPFGSVDTVSVVSVRLKCSLQVQDRPRSQKMIRIFAKKVFTPQLTGRLMFSSNVPVTSAPATVPSVRDLLIDLTLVDPSGARRKIKGVIGRTLYEVCDMYDIDIGPASGGSAPEEARTETWFEPTFGEGTTSGYDHVVLVGKGSDKAQRMTPVEEQMLDDHWSFDEIYEGSRLASAVKLVKEMDGMTVYIPDRIVDDCP
jgi:hypothetical protein